MTNEKKVLTSLKNLVMEAHKKKKEQLYLNEEYSYLMIDYEGPYINEDTGKPDKNCIMYLVNVDSHLTKRLKAKDKRELLEAYSTLYAWVFKREGYVDIVGLDNFEEFDRKNLISNLNAFFKQLEKN
jgi:hypothetical protein